MELNCPALISWVRRRGLSSLRLLPHAGPEGVPQGWGGSGQLHCQNAGSRLATGSAPEAPVPGKGGTPSSAGLSASCCIAGNVSVGMVAAPCHNKHPLGTPAAPPALPGWCRGTIPASLWQGWTLSLLCHQQR